MALDPRTPVIVGVGQQLQRTASVAGSLDAAGLMAAAIRTAVSDAGLAAVPNTVDAIRVVGLLSWRYGNPAYVVADELGVTATELAVTTMGGNSPQSLVNATARDIAAGHLDVAVLTGGEVWRTRMRARKDGVTLDWPKAPADAEPLTIGSEFEMSHPAEAALGIVMPVQMYPIYESVLRAEAGRSPADHAVFVSELWSRFSHVAAGNPNAWLREARSPEELRTVTAHNRMIGLPYPKAMNSNNDVDMAAAVIMCSARWASDHGIARDRWVFPHAGTDCREHVYASHRWAIADTPAVRRGGQLVLELAETDLDDIALIDLYSCFPSAVQVGAASLGLPLDGSRQLTRTGGLSFAGGPWNNYVMHAIATVVSELRERSGDKALVWGNGGFLTKHAFGIYGTEPPAHGFRHASPQDEIDALPQRELATGDGAAGAAAIEGYTVMHDRDGQPEMAIAACLREDGRRAWGVSRHESVTGALVEGEWVGASVKLDGDGTLHV